MPENWLTEAAKRSEAHLMSIPFEHLGPAGRLLVQGMKMDQGLSPLHISTKTDKVLYEGDWSLSITPEDVVAEFNGKTYRLVEDV